MYVLSNHLNQTASALMGDLYDKTNKQSEFGPKFPNFKHLKKSKRGTSQKHVLNTSGTREATKGDNDRALPSCLPSVQISSLSKDLSMCFYPKLILKIIMQVIRGFHR
jgi:hypothetical protein